MADITNHLNTIINGVYGEDVRQAIHDAIEACYTDDRPGGADLKARQQINQILANMIGSNVYEEPLYAPDNGGIFIGGTDQNPVPINLSKYPSQFPYILIYFKTIESAKPEIRMFKGSDFEAGPVVVTAPFLESDGTRASIREFHIKRKSGGLNTEYQLYYTYSWILDGSSATDNGHDVGTRRTLTNADEDKALILCKITGFNPVSDSAEQIAEQLQLLMDFRDSIVTTETTTVATGTASNPASSSETPVDITLSANLPYNKDLKITVTSDTIQTAISRICVRGSYGSPQIGELAAGETVGEYSYSPVATNINKIRILNPTVGATYSATVEQIEETYNSHIATEEYVSNNYISQEYLEENYNTATRTNTIIAATEDRINTTINSLRGTVNSKVSAETLGDVVMLETSGDGVTGIPVASAGSVGQLSNLTTTNKSSVVAAINEVKETAGMNAQAAQALLDLFEHVRFSDDQALVYFNRLKSALGL